VSAEEEEAKTESTEEHQPIILVAEDNAVFRKILGRDLHKWGFEVAVARDCTEALELYRAHESLRILILDWMMPGRSGPEVIREIRTTERGKYAYVILLTAKGQREDIVEGLSSGADDYVIKPFDEHELEVRVRAGKRIVDLQNELIEAREALRFQATHDALTELWDRAAGIGILTRELERTKAYGQQVSALMVDIDHFKEVNDKYGHLAGDAALNWLSGILVDSVRPYDTVSRYGGEEFLVILPGASCNAALIAAERLRALVEEKSRDVPEFHGEITVSVGAAVASRGSFAAVDELISAADVALYRAKHNGRNRVVLWDPEEMQ